MFTVTRILPGFDTAHRITRHESKCRNLHGHRYSAEITCTAELDSLGRVVDFGVIADRVGGWVNDKLDHGTLANEADTGLVAYCKASDSKLFTIQGEPTAENIARLIYRKAKELLADTGVDVLQVRVYETPNCYADYQEGEC